MVLLWKIKKLNIKWWKASLPIFTYSCLNRFLVIFLVYFSVRYSFLVLCTLGVFVITLVLVLVHVRLTLLRLSRILILPSCVVFFIIIIIFACYYHLMSILCLPFRRYALRLRFSYTRNLGICFWTSVYKFFEWLTNNGYKGFNKKSLVDFSSRM